MSLYAEWEAPPPYFNTERWFRWAVERATNTRDLLSALMEVMCFYYEVPTLSYLTEDQRGDAIRRLDELGAFELRYGVVRVAKEMGVSRTTIYKHIRH
jgi:predicted transcriptional regulator YheO